MGLRFTQLAGLGVLFALAAPLSVDAADSPIPKPYKKKHGAWNVSCSACDEGEETLSHCWIASADGRFVLYPGRQDLGHKGDMQWFPHDPMTATDTEPEGNLSFTVDDMAAVIMDQDKTFFAALDGAFVVGETEHTIYYESILFNMKQGRSLIIEINDPSVKEASKQPIARQKFSLEGFTEALEDLGLQAPRYPERAMCE